MEMVTMKKLITKLVGKIRDTLMGNIASKVMRNMTVKIAILCLAVNATTFPMSWFSMGWFKKSGPMDWRIKADQLYQAIAADPENSQIGETIQELDQQTKEDQQKIVDYLLEKSIEQHWFDKAEIFLAHGANPNMQIKYEKGKKVSLLVAAVVFRERSLIEMLLRMRAEYDDTGLPQISER